MEIEIYQPLSLSVSYKAFEWDFTVFMLIKPNHRTKEMLLFLATSLNRYESSTSLFNRFVSLKEPMITRWTSGGLDPRADFVTAIKAETPYLPGNIT
jgi:hypothetical protein